MQENLPRLFKALSDTTRMKIFHSLVIASTALSISQITSEFDMSRQGATKHIKILEKADLIRITTKGRERYCIANTESLKAVNNWLKFYENFWDDSLGKLTDYLDEKVI